MCGGVKEFVSMRVPAPQIISLLHEEIRQYEYGDDNSVSYVPVMKLSNPRDQILKTRHEVVDAEAAAPAGLAIVAAMIGSELVQSGPATMSGHISVEQRQSGAPARAGRMVKPAGRQAAAGRSSAGGGISNVRPVKVEGRKSVFCSAFSPPKDSYIESRAPFAADFMGSCFLCKRRIGAGVDIYIYRGDRAFCSSECRYQHMVDDELSERLQQQVLPAGEPAHCNHKFSSPSPSIPVLA